MQNLCTDVIMSVKFICVLLVFMCSVVIIVLELMHFLFCILYLFVLCVFVCIQLLW